MTTGEFTREFTDARGTRWRLAGVANGRPQYEVWNKLRWSAKLGIILIGMTGASGALVDAFLAVNNFTGVGFADDIAISPTTTVVMASIAYVIWQLRVNRRQVPGSRVRPWRQCLRCYAYSLGKRGAFVFLRTSLGSKVAFWAGLQTFLMVDDVTVVGVADNVAQLPVAAMLTWYVSQVFVQISRYRWITP